MQLYWGDWGVQSMHRGLPCTNCTMGVCAQPWAHGWLWVLQDKGLHEGSWIGAPGWALCATMELWGTIPVLVGTITKHCVDSLHCGQRLASWLQLWALYTALVFSSATPQPIGVSSSWHWLSHPTSPNIHPQPQQCQGLQFSMGCRGTALCLLLLGRHRNQVGNSSGFNKYILAPMH